METLVTARPSPASGPAPGPEAGPASGPEADTDGEAELTVIVVSYNTRALTLRCLETLDAATRKRGFAQWSWTMPRVTDLPRRSQRSFRRSS